MDNITYDIAIIGGGPAGAAAAITAVRKGLKTLLLTEKFHGQSSSASHVNNWLGEEHISGRDLAKKIEGHVRSFKDIHIEDSQQVLGIESQSNTLDTIYSIETSTHKRYLTKALILASGTRRKKLGVKGELELSGRGISYCSTCDASLFKNKAAAVVGNDEYALQAVHDLIPYANKIYFLTSNHSFEDTYLLTKIKSDPKVNIIFNVEIKEILGETKVTGVNYFVPGTDIQKQLAVEGVFIEIGSIPNSEMVKGLVALDQTGHIKLVSLLGATTCPGIFAAGDVTDTPFNYKQIAAGDGMKTGLAAHLYLTNREKFNKINKNI